MWKISHKETKDPRIWVFLWRTLNSKKFGFFRSGMKWGSFGVKRMRGRRWEDWSVQIRIPAAGSPESGERKMDFEKGRKAAARGARRFCEEGEICGFGVGSVGSNFAVIWVRLQGRKDAGGAKKGGGWEEEDREPEGKRKVFGFGLWCIGGLKKMREKNAGEEKGEVADKIGWRRSLRKGLVFILTLISPNRTLQTTARTNQLNSKPN